MQWVGICASPVEDDGGAPLVKGSLEDPQSGDTAGYVSDESVRFTTAFSIYGQSHPLI